MKGDHGRFEALAGAVVLGEATAAERAAFDVHASTCATCAEDLARAPLARAAIERAGAAETWRPSIGSLVLGRIRDGRRSRFRTTIGALGWAVAVSIVFNVALASGIASRFSPLGSGGDVT
ncbi:MAG: zf-HC2 domain-containing protein, partial [Candidatus Eremiobacteraeota bacterium]|nr:zf-HC2 domain-containing protein [Candidatus Eremiobacteraeota bacterium]